VDAGSFRGHGLSLVVGRSSLVLQRIRLPATSDQRPATVTLFLHGPVCPHPPAYRY
jgi:hypothetical protein